MRFFALILGVAQAVIVSASLLSAQDLEHAELDFILYEAFATHQNLQELAGKGKSKSDRSSAPQLKLAYEQLKIGEFETQEEFLRRKSKAEETAKRQYAVELGQWKQTQVELERKNERHIPFKPTALVYPGVNSRPSRQLVVKHQLKGDELRRFHRDTMSFFVDAMGPSGTYPVTLNENDDVNGRFYFNPTESLLIKVPDLGTAKNFKDQCDSGRVFLEIVYEARLQDVDESPVKLKPARTEFVDDQDALKNNIYTLVIAATLQSLGADIDPRSLNPAPLSKRVKIPAVYQEGICYHVDLIPTAANVVSSQGETIDTVHLMARNMIQVAEVCGAENALRLDSIRSGDWILYIDEKRVHSLEQIEKVVNDARDESTVAVTIRKSDTGQLTKMEILRTEIMDLPIRNCWKRIGHEPKPVKWTDPIGGAGLFSFHEHEYWQGNLSFPEERVSDCMQFLAGFAKPTNLEKPRGVPVVFDALTGKRLFDIDFPSTVRGIGFRLGKEQILVHDGSAIQLVHMPTKKTRTITLDLGKSEIQRILYSNDCKTAIFFVTDDCKIIQLDDQSEDYSVFWSGSDTTTRINNFVASPAGDIAFSFRFVNPDGALCSAVQINDRHGKVIRLIDAGKVANSSVAKREPIAIRFNRQDTAFVVVRKNHDGVGASNEDDSLVVTTVPLDPMAEDKQKKIVVNKTQGRIGEFALSSSGHLLYLATKGGNPFEKYDRPTKAGAVKCYSIQNELREKFSYDLPFYQPVENWGGIKKFGYIRPAFLTTMRLSNDEVVLFGTVNPANRKIKLLQIKDGRTPYSYRVIDFESQTTANVKINQGNDDCPVEIITHEMR